MYAVLSNRVIKIKVMETDVVAAVSLQTRPELFKRIGIYQEDIENVSEGSNMGTWMRQSHKKLLA